MYFERSHTLLRELQVHQGELETQNEELIKLRQAAERSEKKYLDLYDFAPVGYFTLGPEGKILEVNQTGSMIIGRPRHELIHTSFIEYISEEYREEFTIFCKRIVESSLKQTCEAVLLRNQNVPLPIQIEGKAIDNVGLESRTCRIVIIDINDRKKSEKALKESEDQLQAIIHGSPIPQYVIDKNHKVIYWNKAMSVITGIDAKMVIGTSNHVRSFDPAEHQRMADLLIDGTPEEIARKYPESSSRSKIAEDAYETIGFFPGLGKSGKWLRITAAAIRDSHNNVLGALETIEDITDIKFAEETVKNANKKLNMLNKVTRHDILNQMMIWSGYINLLEEQLEDNPVAKNHIEKAKTAAVTVQHLITFTRDYQNLGVEMARWQNLKVVVEKTLQQVNISNIKMQILTGAVEIFSDPLIEKVMFNLIDNTIQHGEHATTIQISFKEMDGRGIIVYEDNGVGIPASLKKKLFGKEVGKITGFGLYLSREILNYSGISIQETGEEMKGARFEMIVPRELYKFGS
jgi:PAS domain S-box-containing protein